MNYVMGILIGNETLSVPKRKGILALGVGLNLFLLFIFKYLAFFEQILNSLINVFYPPGFQFKIHQFVLPLGISFYTFQSLSYLIDVYRTPMLVQKNILDLGLFISFFPQLIAGPIVRYHDINEQIKMRKHSIEMFVHGIERFIAGLAKKVLIANTLAEIVDGVLQIPYDTVPSRYLVLVTVAGALQIYYDFSGYSDMAVGMGRMFGFRIMENFNYPFAATSPSDLWKRWHISLGSWFRDYLYIPLGGNRKGPVRQRLNVLIVFTLVGLWHGASYNFIFFSFVCGLGIIHETILRSGKGKSPFLDIKTREKYVFLLIKSVCSYVIFYAIVIIGFMYFRLDMKDGFSFYSSMFNFTRKVPVPVDVLFLTDRRFYTMLFFAIVFAFPWWKKLRVPENTLFFFLKYVFLLILLLLSFGTLATDAYNPFIYFRF
jgi:alginate O-acetyltransferase complex protein AlgI